MIGPATLNAQKSTDSLLTINRIYNSSEYRSERQRPVSWIDSGEAFVTIERTDQGQDHLVRYLSWNNERSIYLGPEELTSISAERILPCPLTGRRF